MGLKRNLTIQLDEDLIEQVKAIALQRGTSVSGLVTAHLANLAAEDARYQQAQRAALEMLEHATDRGDWNWRREDSYGERLDRQAP